MKSNDGEGEKSSREASNSPASKLLSAKDVAEITGLSVETLAQWRSQMRGPLFVKMSRNFVRYRQSDLDDWISERIVRTDQDRPKRKR
jgi:predicted DNA-binding transcriptional regulator AlpA